MTVHARSIEGKFEEQPAPMQLIIIPREHLQTVIPMVLDKLQAVADRSHGNLTVEGIVQCFIDGRWNLWVVWDGKPHAVVATELYMNTGGLHVCDIAICSGDNSHLWMHLLSEIEEFAEMNGCVKVRLKGRKGWGKKLSDYKLTHVILEKAMPHG